MGRPRKTMDEVPVTPTGLPDRFTTDVVGRTNHAMTPDEMEAFALAEGNLRPDGRAVHTVFSDDIIEAIVQQRRDAIENVPGPGDK